VICGYYSRPVKLVAGEMLMTTHRGSCPRDATCRSMLACSWECVQALATNLVCTTGAATTLGANGRSGERSTVSEPSHPPPRIRQVAAADGVHASITASVTVTLFRVRLVEAWEAALDRLEAKSFV
jgi:hypothetical protein